MLQKLNTFLNSVIIAFAGVWVGRSLYTYFDYRARPGLYAITSQPWYASILRFGGLALAVVAAAVLLKLIIRRKLK